MQASSSKKRSTIRILNAKMLDKTGNFGRSVFIGTHLAKASEVRVSCCVKSARKKSRCSDDSLHKGESICILQAANPKMSALRAFATKSGTTASSSNGKTLAYT